MQDDSMSTYTVLIRDLETEMMDKNPKDTPTKELRPNNCKAAAQFVKATGTALMKFVNRIHSLDRNKDESAYEYYVHDILNELIRTDQPYYKNMTIRPVLDIIFDKYCKFLLKLDDEDQQPSQQQSPDDIELADEVIHKLAAIEDIETLSDKAIADLHRMFGQLQMCHKNHAKLVGHMVKLSTSLTPNQYTYVMKDSLCPLIQLSLPPRLCSPVELKFQNLRLTPQEMKEEKGINLCLRRPFHPASTEFPAKHRTCCLAVVVHTILYHHLFHSKELANMICEES